jgi:UTP--glucose-1-phosphate uridylyltransferase
LAYAVQNGRYYDTGNKLEYIKTVIDFGLRNAEMGDDLQKYLTDRLK